jgi:L-ascorbate metabolism protein UlaG (beta-lactamase superfamily)
MGLQLGAAAMQIRFLGHASVRIDLDGVGFLTDPALEARVGPLRRIAGPVEPRSLEAIDAVLVSHLHLDHLDLPSLRRIPTGVLVIVPAGAAAWLRAQGRPNVVELAPGESTDVGGTQVRAVPARHSGFRSPRGPRAIAVGYVIEGRRTVYFAGDTGLFDGLAALAGGVDVALLPVAGWGPTLPARTHLDPVRAARAARLIGASTVVPIHWGTYRPLGLRWAMRADPREPARALVRAAAELAPGSTIVPLDVGATIALP